MTLDLQQFVEPMLRSEDTVVHHTFVNILRCWSNGRNDLPKDFGRKIVVTNIMRQPLVILRLVKQHIRRSLEPKLRPYEGGAINDRRWPTQDLYELEAFDPLQFPKSKKTERLRIAGQEKLSDCDQCNGRGENDCPPCGGRGRVVCRTCNGANRLDCDYCQGKGGVIDVRGYLVECAQCRGAGACECPDCDAEGRATCMLCRGGGKRRCQACAGRGRFRTTWTLITETSSKQEVRRRIAETWELPLDEFTENSHLIHSWQWRRAELPGEIGKLQGELPPALHQELRNLLRDFESPPEAYHLNDHDRVSGLQLELRGTMLHRVDFHYLGREGAAFVGGERYHVIPHQLPLLKRGVVASIKRGIGSYWNEVHEDVREDVSADFVKRAECGEVHMADDRCLIPAAAEILDAQLDVKPTGYDLALLDDSPAGPIWFQLELDADEFETLTVRSQCILGPAHRDRYPAMLAAGAELEFGRVGVVELGGQSFFAIVDNRPYATLSARHLTKILEVLSVQAIELIDSQIA